MKWRSITMWRVVLALQRGAVTWWTDPVQRRSVLRSRAGSIYDYQHTRHGYFIRRRRLDLLD
jgi:hypothetical protein